MEEDAPHALVSVSDKEGIAPFAESIVESGYRIVSTGGTARHLENRGVDVTHVSEVTGFPEIFGGRVKTLHPRIHGGILARDDREEDAATRQEHEIPRIDLVVANLYPFGESVRNETDELGELVEMIDIGGPTLLRAAAKNYDSTTVVCDPSDYERVARAVESDSGPDESLRRELALEAFRHTARYDAVIADHLEGTIEQEGHRQLPACWTVGMSRTESLRYGENPHQKGALYRPGADPDWGGFEKLHGKALSYNNLVDLDAAVQLVEEFERPAAVIVKHTNPAGCATGRAPIDAYERALACDPMSAFGGIVAVNRAVSTELAEALHERYFEVVAAPSYGDEALEILTQKESVRILEMPEGDLGVPRAVRPTALGWVAQTTDPLVEFDRDELEIPTQRVPSDEELQGLAFNWRVCKHVKLNTIVIGGEDRTLGVGAGQMSRVDAVHFAVHKSRHDLEGSLLASDAFFPFRDGIDAADGAGVRAVVQPGGSKNDAEVVEACDEHDIAMVMTGERHFRH